MGSLFTQGQGQVAAPPKPHPTHHLDELGDLRPDVFGYFRLRPGPEERIFPNVRISWAGWWCTLYAGRYEKTGNLALYLYNEATGCRLADATGPYGLGPLPDDLVALEPRRNPGLMRALINAGVIDVPLPRDYPGYYTVMALILPLPADLPARRQ